MVGVVVEVSEEVVYVTYCLFRIIIIVVLVYTVVLIISLGLGVDLGQPGACPQ